ncbi:MAG: transglycosylase SLT domain-containing protein [Bdellovibrionales bacterium]|nr:transglycosylase SLT domain-containing protein [Bdellovibrionales bacterium]
MKVDFLGPTRVLQQLLGTPTFENQARPAKAPEFAELIGQLDPNQIESPGKTAENRAPAESESASILTDKGPLARYSFDLPELMTPQLLPREVPSIEDKSVDQGVKTPTVLKVRRIGEHDDLVFAPKKERVERVGEMVKTAGSSHGIDPKLGMAVVAVESSFDPNALSADGHFSKGLFQLLDSTANTIIEREGLAEQYSPYEPAQNVDLGVRYLRYLHDLFTKPTTLANGSTVYPTANSSSLEKLAVAAFNAGEGRVAASQEAAKGAGMDPGNYEHVSQYLPESTQEYVQKVLRAKRDFQEL